MSIRTIEITDEEEIKLQTALQTAVFRPHDTLSGAEIADISQEALPKAILDIIETVKGKILQVGIVKTHKVPRHVHKTESEIYFHGDGKGVLVLTDRDNQVSSVSMLRQEDCAVTPQGTGHGIESAFDEPITFFNVKYAA